MKKVIFIIALNLAIWFGLTGLYNAANANEYNKTVIGHILTETIKGTDMDHKAILESEMQRLIYALTIEMTLVIQEHLPFILEGLATEIRNKSDLAYKCELLKDSKIKDKDCE